MLTTADVLAASKLGSEEIVLTIVGGTMLGLALTRPRLRWVDGLTETSPGIGVWVERSLTMLAFGIGGYAWVTLFITLRGDLEPGAARLIRIAAYILIAYAAVTHFEPSTSGRTRSLIAACFAYVGWAFFAAGVGAASALSVRVDSISAGWPILRLMSEAAVGCFVVWWLVPGLEAAARRTADRIFENHPGPAAPQDVLATGDAGDAASHASVPIRLLALSVTVPIVTRAVQHARRHKCADDSH
jgi:hypothetical protein